MSWSGWYLRNSSISAILRSVIGVVTPFRWLVVLLLEGNAPVTFSVNHRPDSQAFLHPTWDVNIDPARADAQAGHLDPAAAFPAQRDKKKAQPQRAAEADHPIPVGAATSLRRGGQVPAGKAGSPGAFPLGLCPPP